MPRLKYSIYWGGFAVATALPLVAARVSEAELAYKLARSQSEREAAFRLVHDSYVRSGLIAPKAHGLRVTPYHLLPSTGVFLAQHGSQAICTISLIADSELGIPMETIYGEEVAALREAGIRFAEVSSLADRRSDLERFFPVFLRLIQMLCPYSRTHGIDQLLIAVHPKHARFYERYFKFQVFGGLKSYPQVQNRPAVALCLDYRLLAVKHPTTYHLLFGSDVDPQELTPCPMSHEEREYFGEFLARQESPCDRYSGALELLV